MTYVGAGFLNSSLNILTSDDKNQFQAKEESKYTLNIDVEVRRRCVQCNSDLEIGWERHNRFLSRWERHNRGFVEIGKPFIICIRCQHHNVVKHINEWDLMSWIRKAWHITVLLLNVMIFSVLGVLLLGIGKTVFNFNLGDISIIIYGYIATFIPLASWRIKAFLCAVRESRNRMKDPKYLELLNQLGLIKLVD